MSEITLPPHILEKIQHSLPSALLHDLRTPLGHVLGYAELLQEQAEEAGYKELLPYIQKIHTAGEQLLVMLNENFKSGLKPTD
jgi:signal transduction histidine kinase